MLHYFIFSILWLCLIYCSHTKSLLTDDTLIRYHNPIMLASSSFVSNGGAGKNHKASVDGSERSSQWLITIALRELQPLFKIVDTYSKASDNVETYLGLAKDQICFVEFSPKSFVDLQNPTPSDGSQWWKPITSILVDLLTDTIQFYSESTRMFILRCESDLESFRILKEYLLSNMESDKLQFDLPIKNAKLQLDATKHIVYFTHGDEAYQLMHIANNLAASLWINNVPQQEYIIIPGLSVMQYFSKDVSRYLLLSLTAWHGSPDATPSKQRKILNFSFLKKKKKNFMEKRSVGNNKELTFTLNIQHETKPFVHQVFASVLVLKFAYKDKISVNIPEKKYSHSYDLFLTKASPDLAKDRIAQFMHVYRWFGRCPSLSLYRVELLEKFKQCKKLNLHSMSVQDDGTLRFAVQAFHDGDEEIVASNRINFAKMGYSGVTAESVGFAFVKVVKPDQAYKPLQHVKQVDFLDPFEIRVLEGDKIQIDVCSDVIS